MAAFAIPHRPFVSDLFTGLALPDGVFESSIGVQRVNANLTNTGAAASGVVSVYIESVSDPGIVVTPQTHFVSSLAGGATSLFSWQADFSGATPVRIGSASSRAGQRQDAHDQKDFCHAGVVQSCNENVFRSLSGRYAGRSVP